MLSQSQQGFPNLRLLVERHYASYSWFQSPHLSRLRWKSHEGISPAKHDYYRILSSVVSSCWIGWAPLLYHAMRIRQESLCTLEMVFSLLRYLPAPSSNEKNDLINRSQLRKLPGGLSMRSWASHRKRSPYRMSLDHQSKSSKCLLKRLP